MPSTPEGDVWHELVQSLIPSAERLRFTSSGTEATMMALRLARFNASMDDPNKPPFASNYFTGVPAPAGVAKAPLKVAFVYVSPIGKAGWTYQHEVGRRAMQEALGDTRTEPAACACAVVDPSLGRSMNIVSL